MPYPERNKTTKKLTGRWIADALHSSGLRIHKAYASKQEALGAEAYFKATGELPKGSQGPSRESFGTLARDYAEHEGRVWLAKHYTNKQRFELCVDYFGETPIARIRLAELEKFVAHLRTRAGRYAKPASNRTIIRYLDAAFKVFNYAHRKDAIEGLPPRPLIEDTGVDGQAIPAHIVGMALDALSREAALAGFYATVLLQSGMRCGELDKITAQQIIVPEQREHTGVLLVRSQTKTKQQRWVPLLPETAIKLRNLKASGQMPKRSQVYDTIKAALDSSGEGERYTLHSFRHTAATLFNEAEANLVDVAAILGHSTGMMTQHYTHQRKAHLFRIVEKAHMLSGELAENSNVVPLNSLTKSA